MVPKGMEQQVGNNYENGIIEHVADNVASNETTTNKKISPQILGNIVGGWSSQISPH